jgi:hypothetical protein
MKVTQKTVTLNGEEFQINLVPGSKGIRLLNKIRAIALPALAELQKEEGSTDDIMGAFIQKVMEGMDKVDIEALVKELITACSKNNVAINFDMEFMGEYDKLFFLVKEVVMFNFGSVFRLVGSNVE